MVDRIWRIVEWLRGWLPMSPRERGERALLLAKLTLSAIEARGVTVRSSSPGTDPEAILAAVYVRWNLPGKAWGYPKFTD